MTIRMHGYATHRNNCNCSPLGTAAESLAIRPVWVNDNSLIGQASRPLRLLITETDRARLVHNEPALHLHEGFRREDGIEQSAVMLKTVRAVDPQPIAQHVQ